MAEQARARTLLVFTHPALERTRVNWAMAEAARTVEGVTFHDLYETYPDFAVDVDDEQQRLAGHELIVLQFPLYWYTGPALLKEWLDLVWLQGFAYGAEGGALKGKILACAVSTGARAQTFCSEGKEAQAVGEFLRPFERMAEICGMRWERPFVIHGANVRSEGDLRRHTERYRRRLDTLVCRAAEGGAL
jgi:glutathione-regulated potassium-efflux system ancillary protein KefG